MPQQPLAYLNPEFLDSDEARPIRILSEYSEPLRRFKEQKKRYRISGQVLSKWDFILFKTRNMKWRFSTTVLA